MGKRSRFTVHGSPLKKEKQGKHLKKFEKP